MKTSPIVLKMLNKLKLDLKTKGKEGIIKEYVKTMEIWRFECQKVLKHFNCYQCGWCCKELPVMIDSQEIERIIKNIHITFDEFINRYVARKVSKNLYYLNLPCPFVENRKNGKTICRIYNIRPIVCKIFPFSCDDNRLYAFEICPLAGDIKEELEIIAKEKNLPSPPDEIQQIIKKSAEIRDKMITKLRNDEEPVMQKCAHLSYSLLLMLKNRGTHK